MLVNTKQKLEVKDISMFLCFNLLIYIAMILFTKQRALTIFLTILGTLITFLLIFSKTFRKETTNKTIFFLLGAIGLNNTLICGFSFVVAIRTKMLIKILVVLVLVLIAVLCFIFVGFAIKKEKNGVMVTNSSGLITLVAIFVVFGNYFLGINNFKFELLTGVSFLFFSFFSTFLLKAK